MDLIKHWRKEFGLTVDGDFNQANLHLFVKLFLEEVLELLEEIVADGEVSKKMFAHMNYIKSNPIAFTKDVDTVNKANLEKELADLDYITTGHGWMQLGLDRLNTHVKVWESNMSKLCDTKGEAMLSCSSENPHLKCDPEETNYRITKNGKYLIYNKNTGKILKGINYKTVDEIQEV
jgi:predicted HAD superfamily Cof-like phosphohydrolase